MSDERTESEIVSTGTETERAALIQQWLDEASQASAVIRQQQKILADRHFRITAALQLRAQALHIEEFKKRGVE